jgi:hypothetical protein
LPVNNICDYMNHMGKQEPGETVNVKELRDGKKRNAYHTVINATGV